MKQVSVITVNLNNAPGLESTIRSVIAQKGCDAELIVIDGASSDTSVEVIKAHENRLSYWVSEKDAGIYNAQNKGILKASGDYCLFLNSGDILAGETVLHDLLVQADDKDIVYGDLVTRGKDGKEQLHLSPDQPDVAFFMVSTIWHPTALIRRRLFSGLGPYNDTFRVAGDYEFFIRAIVKNNASTKHVSMPVCVFDLGGISNSPAMKELQEKERRESWQLNFSPAAIKSFEEHTRLLRSREYKVGQWIKRIFKPFSR